MHRRVRYIIGIDEAGRGPLAGPVSVAAVVVPRDFNMFFLRGIKESKQLSEGQREAWFARLLGEGAHRGLLWSASFSSHAIIDRRGITKAVSAGIRRSLRRLPVAPEECLVLLDGGLRAPEEFIRQETIIRGDEREPLIAAASIIAKVRRDRRMKKLAEEFPHYGFEVHKGYGTREHLRAIKEFGLCDIHRTTFCPA